MCIIPDFAQLQQSLNWEIGVKKKTTSLNIFWLTSYCDYSDTKFAFRILLTAAFFKNTLITIYRDILYAEKKNGSTNHILGAEATEEIGLDMEREIRNTRKQKYYSTTGHQIRYGVCRFNMGRTLQNIVSLHFIGSISAFIPHKYEINNRSPALFPSCTKTISIRRQKTSQEPLSPHLTLFRIGGGGGGHVVT